MKEDEQKEKILVTINITVLRTSRYGKAVTKSEDIERRNSI